MSKILHVRNVPDEVHRALETRAAKAGMSLSEYVLRELRHCVERPTPEELRRRIESRHPVAPRTSPATILTKERLRR